VDGQLRGKYDDMLLMVNRPSINQPLNKIGINATPGKKRAELTFLYECYMDFIHNRWSPHNTAFGLKNFAVKKFIEQVQQHEGTYEFIDGPEFEDFIYFMQIFKHFTRGQAKMGYLTKVNENPEMGMDGIIELAESLFFGREVPHPNRFPAEKLFLPAQSNQTRVQYLTMQNNDLLRNFDKAFSGRYDHDFKLLQSGQNPPMQFTIRFMSYDIWLHGDWYKEKCKQWSDVIMNYRRQDSGMLITRDEYIQFVEQIVSEQLKRNSTMSLDELVDGLMRFAKLQEHFIVDAKHKNERLLEKPATTPNFGVKYTDADYTKTIAVAFKNLFDQWARIAGPRVYSERVELLDKRFDRAPLVAIPSEKTFDPNNTTYGFNWNTFFDHCHKGEMESAKELIKDKNFGLDFEEVRKALDLWKYNAGNGVDRKTTTINAIKWLASEFHIRPMDIMYIMDFPSWNHDNLGICGDGESLVEFSFRQQQTMFTSSDYLNLLENASPPPVTDHYRSVREGLQDMLSRMDTTELLKPELPKLVCYNFEAEPLLHPVFQKLFKL
jgi:hypothetical protein